MRDDFLAPVCRPATLDIFLVRRAILRLLRDTLPRLQGRLLDVGCGEQPYRSLLTAPPSRISQYIGLDIPSDRYGRRDLAWDGGVIPLRDATVSCVVATELLEHCPDPRVVLRELSRVLEPGGLLVGSVPFLWPLHDVPYDEVRFTPFALTRLLGDAGFTAIEMSALGGWNAALAQMLGLWARRAPLPFPLRDLASVGLLPLVCLLARIDRPPVRFGESTMITGLGFVARRAPT